MLFRKILVAVDGGAPAARAAATGYALAQELKSEIRLFHAVELSAARQVGMSAEEATKFTEREGQRVFSALIDFLPPSASPQGIWAMGEPAEAALREAAGWPADLVIIGSHGRDGVIRVLLGSVAETIVRHAPCPVLVIKASTTHPE